MSDAVKYGLRVRSFEDLAKGRRVIDETVRGELGQMLLLTVTDSGIQLIGSGVRGTDIGKLIAIATEAAKAAEQRQKEMRLTPGLIKPRADKSGRKRMPEITTDAEGELHTPPGEAFIFCGECGHNTWFVTSRDDGLPGRNACTRCGNEVVYLRMQHEEGRA